MTRRAALACALASSLLPAMARAQHVEPPARAWPAPLDRVVSTTESCAALADALAQLATATRVRFSYSPELLPLERRACLPAGTHALGETLRAVLDGTDVVPVVAGRDQVVLAPGRTSAAVDASPEVARTVGRLERVVVTGTAAGGPERASPFALTVVEGEPLQRAGTRSVAQLLDGVVPGLWMWTQSPASVVSRYGSVRGASSFSVTAPKVYLDGIELANPLLLSQLDATRLQRIEVIRGPQGSALYGTDAISGVINIVTRQDGAADGGTTAEVRAGAGAAASAFAPQGVLTQEHGLQLRGGLAGRSAGLAASVTTLGPYLPGASSQAVSVSGGARRIGTRVTLAGTARYQHAAVDSPASPLLDSLAAAGVSGARQRLRQYTVGGTATLQPSEEWTHVLVAGLDGFTGSGVASDALPVPSLTDTTSAGSRSAGHRATLRANATRRYGSDTLRTVSFTMGVEQSFSRERAPRRMPAGDGGSAPISRDTSVAWSSTGLLMQGQVAWRRALFVQGGARVEQIRGLTQSFQSALLPMLGAAWVRELGPTAALKLRGAYGRGIRPARVAPRGFGHDFGLLALVEPEEQAGTELGADLQWQATAATRLAVQATRFDQLARNLAQPVMRLRDSTCYAPRRGPGGTCDRGAEYAMQNVGAIGNAGWELQASAARGALSLSSSLTIVDSRVRRLGATYAGDLQAGDRMLEVPARTLGVSAAWNAARWSLGASLARASDWRNYDRVALASAYARAQADGSPPPVGAALRQFVRDYPGVTRLGATLDVRLWRATSLTLRGDNLLDRQTGEPDNVTVLPGRSLMLGLRSAF